MTNLDAEDRRTFWLAARRLAATYRSACHPLVLRALVAHVLALGAVVVVAISAPASATSDGLLGVVVAVAFSGLRIASATRRLAPSTVVLDAVGVTLFVSGTGGTASAYFFLAMAGAWWASNLPIRHSGTMWSSIFAIGYAMLVLPNTTREATLIYALENVAIVVVIGLLGDWIVRLNGRAIALSDALARAPAGADGLAIREGLARAMGPMEISIDVLLAAAHSGLTVVQAELLAYLTLGLTNQEIADATMVSEATVRYRLTRLYAALGVKNRKAARERALELGLAPSLVGAVSSA